MRKVGCAIAFAIAVCWCGTASADMSGNVQFLVGQRWLDSDEWAPVDQPPMFGVEVDFAPAEAPVRVAVGAQMSSDSDSTATFPGGNHDVGFFEISAGFLWHPLRKGVVRPYIGAGVLTMLVGIDNDTVWFGANETDQSFGFYGNLGVFFKVGDSFNIGVDGRIVTSTNFRLFGVETDADYEQVALLMGFSWGK